ncbi:hypothetical protein [Algoriphagus halophytocola]|uniref:Uncharacterized protein n=1 Tax=Algoriphagus halophytocola TaxID=2991499 RepID=A0ABY6MHN4_9BACT|nr:hypothetical protein [Algoriphagus sp. TR-M5]UZD23301.1 hypothetical protein OM944_02175 [Algoriphagus sp. TR-M5]
MNKFIKPSSFAFYLLLFLLSFILGAAGAGIAGAAENQGLAGGAIVLGYGLMTALGGVVLALIIISKTEVERIKKANWILLGILLCIFAMLSYKSYTREKSKQNNPIDIQPKRETNPAPTLMSPVHYKSPGSRMGLGLFSPNYHENKVLYFYAAQHSDKPIEDQPKLDSITFSQNEHGNYTIGTAPPWLMPEHMKLDYNILYFKILRIGKDYLQIEGNTDTNQAFFVSKWSGETILWPEFILSTFMLEFPEGEKQPLRIKPLDNASIIPHTSRYMRAISIQDHWVEVEVLNEQWKPIDYGWIKWRDENKLLIQYTLLS